MHKKGTNRRQSLSAPANCIEVLALIVTQFCKKSRLTGEVADVQNEQRNYLTLKEMMFVFVNWIKDNTTMSYSTFLH